MDYITIINKLLKQSDLTAEEANFLLSEIIIGRITQAQTAAILTALKIKGESSGEIEGFIKAMRGNMVKIKGNKDAIDVCGTGGDRSGTFNISTTTAFVCAGAGVKVAKHGNRSASSKCGSADLLEKLGVHINISSQKAEEVLSKIGIVFLFAPIYHAALKNVVSVRKELQFPTIFNFLGPFSNPAGVKRQLIGVPDLKTAEKLAKTASKLDYEHLIIATSEDGLDEISISSSSHIFEIKNKIIKKYIFDPSKYGIDKCSRDKIKGGDVDVNAKITLDILSGQKGPKSDAVIINSAFGLLCTGKIKEISEGIKIASDSLFSGRAKKALEDLIYETNN